MLQQFRADHGLSQSQAAALFPVSVRTLQQWERGYSQPPTYLPRVLNDIARELEAQKK